MTLALTAVAAILGLWALSKSPLARRAARAPGLLVLAGGAIAILLRPLGAPSLPTGVTASLAECGLAALVFASAAQFRISRLARDCPASFRLTLGGAPLFLVLCSLCAFVLLPQLSLPSALLLGAALTLNGAAFDRRAVTAAPAPAAIKAAVRTESAAIIALGAPVAILIAGGAGAAAPGEPALGPLYFTSLSVLKGFALGGVVGIAAARWLKLRGTGPAVAAGFVSFLLAALIGAEPVIAAGAAGLLWGEETRAATATRLRLRRLVEQSAAPAGYFLFGLVLAPRIFDAEMLTVLFAAAAVTVMRAAPRYAMLQSSSLSKEGKAFLAWFGGAPGAASALFVLALIDRSAIVDHEALLTVAAIAIAAGVFAARLTSRPLANAFLRQSARARKRRMYAG